MASIGPSIPAHLRRQRQELDEDDEDDIGPSLPPSIGPSVPTYLLKRSTTPDDEEARIRPSIPSKLAKGPAPSANNDDDEDSYVPMLPPDLAVKRQQGPSRPTPPSKRVIGPSFPTGPPPPQREITSDDDDDYGPMPSRGPVEEKSGVEEFIEREKRRAAALAEASKPKKLERQEWMLVPPTASSLLSNIDPTKLKARQFSRATEAPASTKGRELWTETPQERLQRITDEVSGKRKRAVEEKPVDDAEREAAAKRQRRDEEIQQKVEEHNRASARGAALIDVHGNKLVTKSKDDKEEPPVIWDHDRDMSLGGRLMDDGKRANIIKDAKGLGGRFSRGKTGGYL